MHGTTDPDDRSVNRVLSARWSVLMVLAAGLTLAACDRNLPKGGDTREAKYGCPRPSALSALQPGFNDQEREVRELRRLAFRNDFFAQIELAKRYQATRLSDKNIEDPIEAAVWWAMALTNPQGYSEINPGVKKTRSGFQPLSRYDDCRQFEREIAYARLDDIMSKMTAEERQAVRERLVYILSTQDADGFRTLARLHDQSFGPFGEPASDPQAQRAQGRDKAGKYLDDEEARRSGARRYAIALFDRSEVDAYLYNYLAMQTGDVSAYVLLKDFVRGNSQREQAAPTIESKARRWIPPFEFYPLDSGRAGVPHSDESRPRPDATETALARMEELPQVHVRRALAYLGIIQGSGEKVAIIRRPAGLAPQSPHTSSGAVSYARDPAEGPRRQAQPRDFDPANDPKDGRYDPRDGRYDGTEPRPATRLVSAPTITPAQAQSLQATLGRPSTGRLTNLEKVRAIQLAAISGSAQAQLVLAVMYSEGVGVPADYAKSYHWFEEAAKQGSPEAKFAMSTYFSLGVSGVADQDKARAVALRLEAALAGYRPSSDRLRALLTHISRAPVR